MIITICKHPACQINSVQTRCSGQVVARGDETALAAHQDYEQNSYMAVRVLLKASYLPEPRRSVVRKIPANTRPIPWR